jgi:uncharacterized membrane protein YeaQ/YmgE (transglycosylase-associated protein family)
VGIGSIIATLIIGAVAGFLAGRIVAGYGFGLVGNIVVGVVGAVIAGLLLPSLGLGGWIGSIISATIGAVGLLALVRVVKRA